jgi:hypothetical protein
VSSSSAPPTTCADAGCTSNISDDIQSMIYASADITPTFGRAKAIQVHQLSIQKMVAF